MMKARTTIVGLALIMALFISACQPAQPQTIKLGFVGPLSGSAALYGTEDLNAARLAVKEINAKGGINGKQIELIVEDGKCDGKTAVTAAQKLINVDKVKIILGGTCSGETLAIAPIAEKSEVLLFSSFSSSPEITNAGSFVFRNSPTDVDNAAGTARLAVQNGVQSIAIIAENTDYAQAWKNVFVKTFTEQGGTVLVEETYSPDETDFRTSITKILAAQPEAILIVPQGIKGGLVAKQLSEQGYTGELYGNVVFANTDMLDNYGEHIEGLYFADAAQLDTPQGIAFLNAYEKEYGKKPGLDFYAGMRYDSVRIIANAIRDVGYDANKIKDYLYNLPEYNGVTGTYRFDKNGDLVGGRFSNKQIINGKVRVI